LDFSVQLIGDGPLHAELKLQARNLGLNGRVAFLGYREDVSALLSQSAFLVHTADAEGSPNVILEAMAAGRAAIATDAGDASYLIENGVTGFVVPRGDGAALADCMARLINDPELAKRMGQAARLRAEHEFSLDRLVANTLSAYHAAGWQGEPVNSKVGGGFPSRW
jgi:glycosyltransferase involved in cell wall biosynthesis